MIRSYLKIAFRNLLKNKVYSFINIVGLAVGIACCALIALYVHNEWSFDEFHSESDRIYRAWVQETVDDGQKIINTATPIILGPTLLSNIPEINAYSRYYPANNLLRITGVADAQSETVTLVDSSFFNMFDFTLLRGNQRSVFDNPGSVVLTRRTAKRLFGNSNPMNQSVSIRLGSDFHEFSVTGIMENPPVNSSLQFEILIPFQHMKELVSERSYQSWNNIFNATYVLLDEGANPGDLQPKLREMMKSVLGAEEYEAGSYKVGLQPLTDIHLNPDLPPAYASVSDPMYSYILGAIALLVLLIACVNFMTLSISKSASRAKEVGIRKTMGAIRRHLMYQF